MEEILIASIQILLEVLGDIVLWGPWDLALTAQEKRHPGENNSMWPFVSLIIGVLVGAFSLILFPRVWIMSPHLRVANLILAPLAVYYLAGYFAGRRRDRGAATDASAHRVSGACFCIGLTFIRFAFALR